MPFLTGVLLLAALCAGAAEPPAPMPYPRYGHASVYVDGKLFVIGGQNGQFRLETMDVYSPASDTWRPGPRMRLPRAFFSAEAVGRKIIVFGGETNGGLAMGSEIYDLDTDRWSALPPLPVVYRGQGMAALGGVVYSIGGKGGRDFAARQTADVVSYDTRTKAWGSAPALPSGRQVYDGAAALDGRVYVAGGHSDALDAQGVPIQGRWHDEVLSWAAGEKSWRKERPLPRGRSSAALAAVGGRLYYAGGSAYERHDWNDLLSAAPGGDWVPEPSMPTGRSSFSAAGGDGLVFFTGGSPGRNEVLDTLEIFDTRAKTWRSSKDRVRSPVAAAPPLAPPAVEEFPDLPAVAPRPDDYALVVGLEDYRSVGRAAFGERDARAFARYATVRLGVPKENIILLTGTRATKTDISKYVEEWLPRNAEKKSRVFVYYSGHGAPDPETGESYLVPWDGDPQFLKSSGYSLPRLYENLEKLKASKVIVFLDSCFSGAGGRSVIAKNLRPLVHVLEAKPKTGKVSVLSASAASQVAGGSEERRHGLFTWHLLEALGGDASRDGHLDLSSLHEFVATRVSKAARRDNREQDPQLRTSEPSLRLY